MEQESRPRQQLKGGRRSGWTPPYTMIDLGRPSFNSRLSSTTVGCAELDPECPIITTSVSSCCASRTMSRRDIVPSSASISVT